MGGYGSGRKPGKLLTSDMLELDIRFLNRRRYIKSNMFLPLTWTWNSGEEAGSIGIRIKKQCVLLKYYFRASGKKYRLFSMTVKLDWTPCHYGGHCPWFLCPYCGRRAAILYAGQYFYCRICQNLAYPSENEDQLGRLLRQANKIRRRLNCKPGVQNKIFLKPKGMHYKTFDRLRSQVDRLEYKALRHSYDKLIS
jgi:hypothetical protein